MTLSWPNETHHRQRAKTELETFLAGYYLLPNRLEAGKILANMAESYPSTAASSERLEDAYPKMAARLRVEEDSGLRTIDGLLAEATIDSASHLDPIVVVRQLGALCGRPVSRALITDALRDKDLCETVTSGLCRAFKSRPFFTGDDEATEGRHHVEDMRRALEQARQAWADPASRDLRDLHAPMYFSLLVEPIHLLLGPLSKAAPAAAMTVLDTLPSALDAALCLERRILEVKTFEQWAAALRAAPAAWDADGWVGKTSDKPCGLALPFLLLYAEDRLLEMTFEAPGCATPMDVAMAFQRRADGADVAWRWCADLIKKADQRERDGRGHTDDGYWRTAQALAENGSWSRLDPGNGQQALLLEAAKRLVPGSVNAPLHLNKLLPDSPESFLQGPQGEALSRTAFGLVGGFGPMFEGHLPYGLAVRILSSGLWGDEGPGRLKDVWQNALVLRELAAGGVLRQGPAQYRQPEAPLHLIIAMGIAALEMGQKGAQIEADAIRRIVSGMLEECAPWDLFGYTDLRAHFHRVCLDTRTESVD